MAYDTRERAGITVEQVVETVTPTPLEPTLIPVAVGPCYQKVEAVDSAGSPRSEAQTGTYSNLQRLIKSYGFPDPRSNLSYLSFLTDEIRAFLQVGAEVREFKDDERFLIGNYTTVATSVRAIGSSTTSRQLQIVGGAPAASFLTVADEATITGDADMRQTPTGDVDYPGDLDGETFQFRVDGYGTEVTVVFDAPADETEAVAQINAAWVAMGFTGVIASLSTNFLKLTSQIKGDESHIKVNTTATTCEAVLGFVTPDTEDRGTAYKPQAGDDFYADGVLIGTIVSVDAADKLTLDTDMIVYTGATPGELDATQWFIRAKNLTTPKAADRPTPELYKTAVATTATLTGTEVITGNPALDGLTLKFTLDSGTEVTVTFTSSEDTLAKVADKIDLTYGADVASVVGNQLKLTSPTNGNESKVEIGTGTANTGLGFVSLDSREGESVGDFRLAPEFLRNALTGLPLDPGNGVVYIQYRALRKDVTVLGQDPDFVRATNETDLETLIGPLTTENPLGLAGLRMLGTAPGLNIALFGVDSVASDAEGDLAAYQRAFAFLKARNVYAIAPLSQNEEVHDALATHVDYMSEPLQKGFRCCYVSRALPTNKATTVASSGTDANSISLGLVETEADLSAALLNEGIADPASLSVSDGVYMKFEGDTDRYNISGVTGHQATGNTTFGVGENTDGFYTTDQIPATIIAKSWTLYIRGAAITAAAGVPDYNEMAGAYQDTAKNYASRRVRQVVPSEVTHTDGDSVSQRTEGYYLAAASAAQLCYLEPQQGKTNYPIDGFTQLHYSNDYFPIDELKILGYNNYLYVQEPVGSGQPITRWHQATTDPTNDGTREESVTTCLDWGSIILMRGLKNFIGRVNITKNFDDLFSEALDALITFVKEEGVWLDCTIVEIGRVTGSRTGIFLKLRVDVPYPVNDIGITLYV